MGLLEELQEPEGLRHRQAQMLDECDMLTPPPTPTSCEPLASPPR